MTDTDEHIRNITEAHDRLLAAERDLRAAVLAARHRRPRPVTWDTIGAIVGVTRQGAMYRFRGHR